MELDYLKKAVVTIALLTFLGAAAGIALSDFGDDVVSTLPTTTTYNETETSTTNSSFLSCDFEVSVIQIRLNSSDNVYRAHSSPNISVDSEGRFTVNLAALVGNVSLTDYTCKQKSIAYNSTYSGLYGVSNTTGYMDVIGTIIGIAVLVGLILTAFAFARR